MGIIVGVGGGRTDDNEILPVFEHIVKLAKKKNPSVLFVPTAGFDDINGDEHIFRLFIGLGCSISALMLTERQKAHSSRSKIPLKRRNRR